MNKLEEYRIKDILASVNDYFYNHKKHVDFYRKNSQYYFIGIKNFTYYFAVKSSGEYEITKNNIYKIKIEFPQLKNVFNKIKRIKKKSYLKKIYLEILSVIEYGDVKLSCTCPAFKYLGYNYILSSIGSKSGEEEIRYPKIKNAELEGIVCKHLDVVLTDFKKEKMYKKYIDIMFDWMFYNKFKEDKIKWWRIIINYFLNFQKMEKNFEKNI